MTKKVMVTKCFKCHRVLQANAKYCKTCGSRITMTSKRKTSNMPEVVKGPLDDWVN